MHCLFMVLGFYKQLFIIFFLGRKGIKQGDPLSPYIFLFSMEILSQTINSLGIEGRMGYNPRCKQLALTHLCFADDLIIFTDGFPTSFGNICATLQNFYSASGLKLTVAKTVLFCAGISSESINEVAATSGFQCGSLLVRYLGVPLVSSGLRHQDCQGLIDKVIAIVRS